MTATVQGARIAPLAGRAATVLLFTCERWAMAGLLADAMVAAGLKVAAIRPRGHVLSAMPDVVQQHFAAPDIHRRLARAIDRLRPDILVPADDHATSILHAHHARYRHSASARHRIALIERSLGDPAHYGDTRAKSRFVAMARDLGLPAPASRIVDDEAHLDSLTATCAWPAVLKTDGWASGRGVAIVHDPAQARAAYLRLKRLNSRGSQIKDMIREGSLLPLYRRRLGGRRQIVLQDFADGRPVNRAVICANGQVLAGRTFEAIETMPNHGNATVVRMRDIPAIDRVVEQCVAALGLSGLHGFDFVYDEATGAAHLLEINPRATSAAYIAPPGLAPLIDTLADRLLDRPSPPQPRAAAPDALIALFPQELHRDPASSYLMTPGKAVHPAPWRRPALVEACIAVATQAPWRERLIAALKGVSARA